MRVICTITNNGKFLVSSAWSSFRKKRVVAHFDHKVGHKFIPFKIPCMTWRIIHDRFLIDGKIIRYFAGTFDITYRNSNLRALLINCWNKPSQNSIATFIHIILLLIIIWEMLYGTSSVMVTWIKSPLLFVKLDNDGSCISCNCGDGGVIRTSTCNLVMAYSILMGRGTIYNSVKMTSRQFFGELRIL
ncbi:hypothetical protein H5410_046691 [Solanum commersonii]|uniref:Uncharacterized protein n=1 Tax=Solanum commersonii TaxID=4109 RepID=A0A9J5XCZ2_SOLCO|nr:hypothetical protein H5410_046691 [Solanum commersonii]